MSEYPSTTVSVSSSSAASLGATRGRTRYRQPPPIHRRDRAPSRPRIPSTHVSFDGSRIRSVVEPLGRSGTAASTGN